MIGLMVSLLVNIFKQVDEEFLSSLKDGLLKLTEQPIWQQKQGTSVVLQHRYAEGSPSEVIWGELDSSPVVVEHGLKYQLNIGRNQNFGLFLDMRNGRQWVQENSKGQERIKPVCLHLWLLCSRSSGWCASMP